MRRDFRLLMAAWILTLLTTGSAQAGPNMFKLLEDVEMHGFVSSSYSYNFNRPASQTNCGVAPLTGCVRIFDQDDNSFKLDNTELVFLKDARDKGDIGFRFDLTFGFSLPEGAQRARSSAVAGGTPGLSVADDDFDLQQSFVTWNAPIGNGLKIDVGKFITHVGAEVFDGYDGWNANFSRTFAFGWAIPFTHTGVRATYELTDQWHFMFMIANNWEEAGVTDNNSDKSFGAQIGYAPFSNVSILLNWAGGNQGVVGDNGVNSNWRNIFDTVIDIGLTDRLTLQLNADYGAEEHTGPAAGTAKWYGAAGIVRYDFTQWFSLNVRGAWFRDQDGLRLGAVNNSLREVTVTPEFRILSNMVVRVEYRHDESNLAVFESQNGAGTTHQDTVALNTLIYF